MRGPFDEWISVVDELESGMMNATDALHYLLAALINRSSAIKDICDKACNMTKALPELEFSQYCDIMIEFFETTKYSARAFEVTIHSFMQAYKELKLTDCDLAPLSQMRSANKKHGNIGDIELKEGKIVVESWDAKYGKPYLYEELGELKEKLEEHPDVTNVFHP